MKRLNRIGVIPLAALVFGAALLADLNSAAAAHPDVDVEVEHLWVSRDGGRYVLDYEFADRGWHARMEGGEFYVNLYLPGARGDYRVRHAVPIRSHAGTVRFPTHLPYRSGWSVGIGLVIVDPGTRVHSGWVVRSPSVMRVHRTRYRDRGPSVRFRLNYHDRLHHYAWFGAKFGFRIGTHHGAYRKPTIIHRETHRRYRDHRPYYRRDYYRRWRDDDWRDDDWRRRSEPSKRWKHRSHQRDHGWKHRRHWDRDDHRGRHRGFRHDDDRWERHRWKHRHRFDRDDDRWKRRHHDHDRSRRHRGGHDDDVRTRHHHRRRGHDRDDD
jgi:hypothetical protein